MCVFSLKLTKSTRLIVVIPKNLDYLLHLPIRLRIIRRKLVARVRLHSTIVWAEISQTIAAKKGSYARRFP